MEELIIELKEKIIEALNLEEMTPEDIDTDAPLFGEGLGLDSIDALELIVLLEKNPWNGKLIRDLDLSRQTMIVMVKRGSRTLIPKGSTRLQAGDKLLLHTKETFS